VGPFFRVCSVLEVQKREVESKMTMNTRGTKKIAASQEQLQALQTAIRDFAPRDREPEKTKPDPRK